MKPEPVINQHNRIKRFLFFNEMKKWGVENSIEFLFTVYSVESDIKTITTDDYEPSEEFTVNMLCEEIISKINLHSEFRYPKELLREYKLKHILL